MDSLQVTDAASAAVATAPRVSLDDIKAKIVGENWFTAGAACDALGQPCTPAMGLLTIYIATMANGFTVIGKSAPASPENFNPDLGMKFAKEDAIRQIWPLEGYALRERMSAP